MGSASQQQYSLSWGDFGSSLTSQVQLLRGHGDLVDVTLAAEGRRFSAHKIVLSAASPFLLEILKSTPCQHPVVMLAGIGANELEAILEFVYRGQISVEPSQLPSLLQAAQCLSIHGLTPPTILTQKGEQVPISAIPGCNDPSVTRDTMNSYLPIRRKKKRKISGGGGKWPKRGYSSLETRSLDDHSEDNRSVDYGHKDGDDGSQLGDEGDWNSKSRTLSDQPATCPLCGATIRQSRNLRRHLELLHFGAGSGSKSGLRIKKDKTDKSVPLSLTPRSPPYSRASLTLRDNAYSKQDATDYSTMPSLNLSSSVGASSSNLNVPGSFMLGGSGGLGSNDHGHGHPSHPTNNNPAHSMSACPPSSMTPHNNSIYSSDSMLSSLFPTLPTLPTLSSPHDMFRHSEFFRANMGYSQDPSRQQHPGRHMQRTDVT
ncbi:broad-complex core protein isoforms 1/2/3/4/5 isoform X1 [Nasonia vitripennis]|uniref:Uncharacterized protein n=1 Tax=Nasonia vitripennis TaxID=7425 RepID=A0A7M7Q1L2_NASVI|nr:broad-complex core protein isoforms 1/2/3/4/5 isoform X1 [Nasonia vitripennis]XP_031780158.1 broad-complex core protein isoforms 1/2/3/4/5 isoform X1 [Nasonia vitripennis]XP_031780159.1 broad-complex core protein isoforms 1/2/3/4/5 isoform X1 [Nasonia vitripennis]XP_031780160.1 broad-complex core protein isoforms 1/2/3/4/5 isoform X1 [Nasonia vitripennis]XP_031780161.1 broad-complex core protein isoforms 1/2/3/4/5 isoform X1 [Nasonia vitripennis]XP_031780162.1 broad-complex core protein iso